ncbi:Replication protein A 70 kDa DNA-binding subunit A [Linum perenne]
MLARGVNSSRRFCYSAPTYLIIRFSRYFIMSFHLIDELALQAKKWLIQARVSRSWLTYTPNKPTPLRLDLILMDRKGNAIWTHIPNYLIHQFEKQLTEQKVYVFKNFKVSMAPKSYKPLPNQFIILFTSNTTVEEIGDIPCIPMYTFTFIKEAEMGGKLKHIINLSDAIGHLVEHTRISTFKSGFRTSLKKDLHIILPGGCSVRVTLWARAASLMDDLLKSVSNKGVVLIITSIYVCGNTVGDLYFSSSSATNLYVNLDIPEVSTFVLGDYGADSPIALPPPVLLDQISIIRSPTVSIQELHNLMLDDANKDKYYTIQCKVKDINEGWCYTGCLNCPRKVKVEEGQEEYYCWSCEQTFNKTSLRFRVKLQVIDSTAESELIIFDYEGQRFFNIDADKLYAESGETRTPPNHLMQLIDQQMKFQIKLPSYFCNSVTEYPVHRILEGTIEAVTPPADSPVQEQGELVRGNSSSQSLNSTITATEIPAQLLPINLNLENSNAKKTLGKRKKTSIQGISTSDSEDQE